MHELPTEAGVFNTMFSRNCFDLVEAQVDLNIKINMSVSVSVREAVNILSMGGDQGMVKCNCTSACATNRCSCHKSGLLCNSRCHGGNGSCKNK